MTPIMLTHHTKGFGNRLEGWSLGNREGDGAVCGCYLLPQGYSLDWEDRGAGPRILDPQGQACGIVTARDGRPQLISVHGSHLSEPVLEEVPRG